MTTLISVEALYRQLGSHMADPPDLQGFDASWTLPASTIQWLGKAVALVQASGQLQLSVRIDNAVKQLVATYETEKHAKDIMLVLTQLLFVLELQLPVGSQGAFVAAGASFDAYAALSKIVSGAKSEILIVDPYMDITAVTDVAVLARTGVRVRLLSDAGAVKQTLKPAADKWIQQYGPSKPLEARLAPARTLHDRLVIIDAAEAWILTQSLKDFAARSPATIQRADADLAAMKVHAFQAIWNAAVKLS